MAVRARFKAEIVEHAADFANVKLKAAVGGSEENKSFYRRTPSGSIFLLKVNKEAAARFVPGKEYYVDFTPADGDEGPTPAVLTGPLPAPSLNGKCDDPFAGQ